MKKLTNIIYGTCGVGILWVLASWVDVILHNTTTFQYATWNLFKILFQEGKKMTAVTYIVTPNDKKQKPYEVKTLKQAVQDTNNRKTGNFKAKYTKVEEVL